jgi:FkbM family methyltransferase
LQVFDQIFVDREYRCVDGLSGIRTIVDAGANVGYSSAYFLSHFPDAEVIALEPDPENFKALERNLAAWGDRVTTLQVALWSEPAALNFRSETLHEGGEWGRQVEADRSGSVEALDIPSILDRFGLTGIDLLKIDIEGAEREVFASPDWLDRVRNMVIELHGSEEERIFSNAIQGRDYSISRCEELTVCLS